LFHHSLMEGDEYFYQLNDDLKLITGNWTESFINKLMSSKIFPNFGITGPLDDNYSDKDKNSLLTQSFCHKTHYLIFGYLYPLAFKNWFSDDWISNVYNPFENNHMLKNIHVQNSNIHGTRYSACVEPGRTILSKMLLNSKIHINEWLNDHMNK